MGFLDGLVSGLTDDYDDYDNRDAGLGDLAGLFLAGFARGAGGEILKSLADDEEDQGWYGWVNTFQNEVNANEVYFEVSHKLFHDECTLNVFILDENSNIMASSEWEVPYDDETKELHKKSFPLRGPDAEAEFGALYQWVCSFNSNPEANRVYTEVSHQPGDENCTVTATIYDANGNVIDSKGSLAPYTDDIKGIHKDWSVYPIGETANTQPANTVSQAAIEPPQSQNNASERLAKLKQLFDSGIIDENEYKEKKKELLELL